MIAILCVNFDTVARSANGRRSYGGGCLPQAKTKTCCCWCLAFKEIDTYGQSYDRVQSLLPRAAFISALIAMVSWAAVIKTELLMLLVAAAAQLVVFWPGSFDMADSLPLALESFVYYGVLRIGGQLVLSTAGLMDRRGYTGTRSSSNSAGHLHTIPPQTYSLLCLWLLEPSWHISPPWVRS